MKIRIHELATKEFDDAIIWYDQQSEGLGKRFKKTVKDSILTVPFFYQKRAHATSRNPSALSRSILSMMNFLKIES